MKNFHITVLTGALVDSLAHIDHRFLKDNKIPVVQHRLIDKNESAALQSILPETIHQSGGTLSNTISTLGHLGKKGCCLAKVFDDAFGKIFLSDLEKANIHFPIGMGTDNVTGHSIIMVSPDAERIMNTCLGGTYDYGPQDLCEESLSSTDFFCGEAYSWPNIETRKTLYHAVKIAKQGGSKIVFCLSAEGCLQGHQPEIIQYIKDNVDILIGNILEYKALLGGEEHQVIQQAKKLAPLTVITKGKEGSVICCKDMDYRIDPAPAQNIIDTTGAGDAYAAGFLYGMIEGAPLPEAGWLGSMFASQTIVQTGARPNIQNIQEILK